MLLSIIMYKFKSDKKQSMISRFKNLLRTQVFSASTAETASLRPTHSIYHCFTVIS